MDSNIMIMIGLVSLIFILIVLVIYEVVKKNRNHDNNAKITRIDLTFKAGTTSSTGPVCGIADSNPVIPPVTGINGVNLISKDVTVTVYKLVTDDASYLLIPGTQPDKNNTITSNLFTFNGFTTLVSDSHPELKGYKTNYSYGSVNDSGTLYYGDYNISEDGRLTIVPFLAKYGSSFQNSLFGCSADPTKFAGVVATTPQTGTSIGGPNDAIIVLSKTS